MLQPVEESATNLRYQSLQLMLQLQRRGGSLTRLLPEAQLRVADSEQAQLQAWIFGWCRWAHEVRGLVDQLLDKPLKTKDLDVYLLIQLGIFQLRHTPTAKHAAVDETVNVVRRLKKPWAKGLVNAVLRNYQRQLDQLDGALTTGGQLSHPQWMIDRFRKDWPERWEAICAANNVQAPMCLRVNRLKSDTDSYQQELHEAGMSSTTLDGNPDALLLDAPVSVNRLPGFAEGHVSVQDAAAQSALLWLKKHVPAGGSLLDSCAAPGGKSAHAAESGHFRQVVAIDTDKDRLERVTETLQRLALQQQVRIIHSDATLTDQWWDKVPFNAVLLDAPCSGTGVIRRHPDIKLLRLETDIKSLVQIQRKLLDALWQTLEVQGVFLYATCSILKDENEHQVAAFLERTPDAQLLDSVRQIFPGEQSMDGFFYAAMKKQVP